MAVCPRFICLGTICLGLFAILLPARGEELQAIDQWPQWRGPLASGAAPNASPPVEWSETKNVKWKVKIPGGGTSTPIVWGNKIFLLTAMPVEKPAEEAAAETNEEPQAEAQPEQPPARQPGRGGRPGGGFGRPGGFGGGFGGGARPSQPHQFMILCLDRQTGETLWQRVATEQVPHEGHHRDHGYASFSPITDGECVVAFFGSRGVFCYDMEGNLQWEKQLGKMQTRSSFGEGTSPALHGNTIVITWDHEGDDFIVALDKKTGEELWRKDRDEPTTWATPLILERDGVTQVITPGTNRCISYNLENGDIIWHSEGLTTNAIPSPVADHRIAYLMSGFRGSSLLAIKLTAQGDLTQGDAAKEQIVWTHGRSTPYVPSPLLYDNRLYFFASNNAQLSCFNASEGESLYGPTRLPQLNGVYASPVGADGRVYLVGRNGVTQVIKNADTFESLAVNALDEDIDASPAAVGKELFLRGRNSLYCISEEK